MIFSLSYKPFLCVIWPVFIFHKVLFIMSMYHDDQYVKLNFRTSLEKKVCSNYIILGGMEPKHVQFSSAR